MARVLVPTTEVTPPKATHTTALSGTNNDLVFTARRGGSWGNDIRIRYVDPGAPSVALSVTVDGFDITVTLATDGSSVITSTAAEVAAKVTADLFANQLVEVENASSNNGTGVVDDFAFANLAGGEYAVVQPAGTAADATNDHYLTDNDGDTELEVSNATGSSKTVTVHYAALVEAPSDPEVVTIADGVTKVLGPCAAPRFQHNAPGGVYFDPSASSASLTFKARKVSRVT